jgi:hypothetical protein
MPKKAMDTATTQRTKKQRKDKDKDGPVIVLLVDNNAPTLLATTRKQMAE